MPILAIFINRVEQFKPTKPRRLVMGTKGVGTRDARGWFHNQNQVGSWRCPCWALILVPNYVMLVLRNEGGIPHHMQVLSYTGPRDQFKEATLNRMFSV